MGRVLKESWQRGGFSVFHLRRVEVGGVQNQPDILAAALENSLQHTHTLSDILLCFEVLGSWSWSWGLC